MIYLATCLLCVIGIELFIALPFLRHIAALGDVSRKTMRVISSARISDHWKEKALQRYSRDMAVSSLTLGLLLAVLFVIVYAASIPIDALLGGGASSLEYIVTVPGLVLATAFSVAYVYVRRRLVSR
ncbi:MAG: hypothetical protein R3228_11670 [Halioglobus sp.]|nr:hypothetical protein [Halioglobus sp.]